MGSNELTGAIPTQIGMMVKIVTAATNGFLSGNEHTGETIPTELGALTGMTDGGYFLWSSKLGGTIPSELGRMSVMSNRFNLNSNSLSSSIPTQLGQLSEMITWFRLNSNQLCSDVPTEVQALSSGVTSGWQVTTGNSIGTKCGDCYYSDARFPELCWTTVVSVDYKSQGLTGTIPTQVSEGRGWPVCVGGGGG